MGTAVGILVLIAALVGGCGSAADEAADSRTVDSDHAQVPDVLGLGLDEAKDRLGADLDAKSVDATGRDRVQIVDSNWHVVQQDPTAGSVVPKGATVTLHVVKEGESVSPTSSPTATVTPSAAPPATDVPAATQPAPQEAVSQPAPPPVSTPRPADPLPPANNPPPANDDPPATYYANCAAVHAAGAAPLYAGEPGYRLGLDSNQDGVACER
ncbi:Excalibur domain protein [Parafrankia sp. EAN1pec]|uniref:excalibur calcium-binding domain-containing protein n=1 Tax=Parafrankia sp. (strain EAN1pec) TaxID=298653 RepID=UPI0000543F06|nr:Excalibur domain protein [Frankia sp. EAN1pec]